MPSGLGLDVRCPKDVAVKPLVLERAQAMLLSVLRVLGIAGVWRFDIVGESRSLPNPSQYRLEAIEGSELMPGIVHVSIRSVLFPQGTVAGVLRLPPGFDRASFLRQLAPVVRAGNATHWQGVIEPEVRPVLPTTRPAAPSAPPRVRRDDDDSGDDIRAVRPLPVDGRTMISREWQRLGHGRVRQLSPEEMTRRAPVPANVPSPAPQVAVQPTAPPSPALRPTRRARESWKVKVRFVSPLGSDRSHPTTSTRRSAMPDPVHAQSASHEVHARLLERLLQGKENGVFMGRDMVSVARELFAGKTDRWYATGCTMELIGLKWIRQVGPSTYQAEESFVSERGLVGIELRPLPKTGLSDRKNRKSRSGDEPPKKRRGKAAPSVIPTDSIAALLAERAAVEERLVAAQAELAALDERLRGLVGPLAEKLYPALRPPD